MENRVRLVHAVRPDRTIYPWPILSLLLYFLCGSPCETINRSFAKISSSLSCFRFNLSPFVDIVELISSSMGRVYWRRKKEWPLCSHQPVSTYDALGLFRSSSNRWWNFFVIESMTGWIVGRWWPQLVRLDDEEELLLSARVDLSHLPMSPDPKGEWLSDEIYPLDHQRSVVWDLFRRVQMIFVVDPVRFYFCNLNTWILILSCVEHVGRNPTHR